MAPQHTSNSSVMFHIVIKQWHYFFFPTQIHQHEGTCIKLYHKREWLTVTNRLVSRGKPGGEDWVLCQKNSNGNPWRREEENRLVRSCSDNQGRPGQDEDIVNSLNTVHTGAWTYSTVQTLCTQNHGHRQQFKHCSHRIMDIFKSSMLCTQTHGHIQQFNTARTEA